MLERAPDSNHRFGIPHKDPRELAPTPPVPSVPRSFDSDTGSLLAPSSPGVRINPLYKPTIPTDTAYKNVGIYVNQMRGFFSQFEKQSREAIAGTEITIDLSEVRAFPSMLAAVLIRGCKELQEQGGTIRVICGAESSLYEKLRMFQLSRFATLEKLPRLPATVDDL